METLAIEPRAQLLQLHQVHVLHVSDGVNQSAASRTFAFMLVSTWWADCKCHQLVAMGDSAWRSVKQMRCRRSVGLFAVRGVVLLVVVGIRESKASEPSESTLLFLLLTTVVATTAAFLRVQASDPGYLDEGA